MGPRPGVEDPSRMSIIARWDERRDRMFDNYEIVAILGIVCSVKIAYRALAAGFKWLNARTEDCRMQLNTNNSVQNNNPKSTLHNMPT